MRPQRTTAKSEGGPYDGRTVVHYGTWHRVAYERHRPNRAVPGMVAGDPDWIAFGIYVFHPLTEKWHWFADENSAPTAIASYDLWIKELPSAVPAIA
jgi:hypothetical protein